MKETVLLVVDMEGCCGIYDMNDKEDCKQKMIDEVDFVISELNQVGYKDITVLDCHNDGMTLKSYCQNHGLSFVNHLWSLNGQVRYSFALLVGFHGKAGAGGYFPHTIRQEINSMYMGNNCIGEVSLVINYLSYYDIPVVYVGGDKSIEQELMKYQGVFYATKTEGVQSLFLPEQKSFLSQAIICSLKAPRSTYYIDQQVAIKLRNDEDLKFIPREEFVCRDGLVLFSNTIELINKMKLFCAYLNISAQYHYLRIKSLSNKIKACIKSEPVSSDERILKLLYTANTRDFTDDDFAYLTQFATLSREVNECQTN